MNRNVGEMDEGDAVYEQYIRPFMSKLSENVQQIWQYAFMEMMNNAIGI